MKWFSGIGPLSRPASREHDGETVSHSTFGRLIRRLTNTPLKKRLALWALFFFGFYSASIAAILIAWAIPLGDFAPVLPIPKVAGIVAPIAPDPQLEKHTCGFNALSAIYRSYGLDPAERRLRQRLGVDQTSYIYDPTSTGSIHPDIYRVLSQDGFEFSTPALDRIEATKEVTNHLASGRYVLALIQRRQTGRMHWVVICGFKEHKFINCDSLAPAPYEEDVEDFLGQCILGLTFISPRKDHAPASVWRLHLAGVRDMYRAAALQHQVTPNQK